VASLPSDAAEAIAALQPDGISEPIALDDGYHVYRLIERADRPLDPAPVATVSSTAFEDWYRPIQDEAEEAGRITRDESVFG
jgi:parvulin-like peptidyl-prolyl isomerase